MVEDPKKYPAMVIFSKAFDGLPPNRRLLVLETTEKFIKTLKRVARDDLRRSKKKK